MLWIAAEHTDQDNLRWCWLRAVEWKAWPGFVSIPLVPLLLVAVQPLLLFAVLIALNLLWAATARRFSAPVNLAAGGALFVQLKWLTCPLGAILLLRSGHVVLAIVALLWPVLAGALSSIPPGDIGPIQVRFMARLGYEPTDANPGKHTDPAHV